MRRFTRRQRDRQAAPRVIQPALTRSGLLGSSLIKGSNKVDTYLGAFTAQEAAVSYDVAVLLAPYHGRRILIFKDLTLAYYVCPQRC